MASRSKPESRAGSCGRDRPIAIGLVNNMPDAALRSTDRQFRELLSSAAGSRAVLLRVFSDMRLLRCEAARTHTAEHHEDLGAMWDAPLDGLIVTGNEPKSADLAKEPDWPTLMRLADWAGERKISTIWSCLAAHAAVRHLDGIDRRLRPEKLSGVFECRKVASDPMLAGAPAQWFTPHSRYNELAEQDLVACGYQILARGPVSGADTFVKRNGTLFLFLQGHPEYDACALFREYHRDVRRFLAGERRDYPELPAGYFTRAATEALQSFRDRAARQPDNSLLPSFPAEIAQQNLAAPWHAAAVTLFGNWLSHLAGAPRLRSTPPRARRAAVANATPVYG